MKLLAAVLRDTNTRDKLEADFQSEYHLDLRDLYRPESTLTLRRCLTLFEQLPSDSRIMKWLRNDLFDQKDHLLASILDTIRRVDFSTNVGARATISPESQSVFDSMPEPIKRPVFNEALLPLEEKPEPIKFASAKELKKLMKAGPDGAVKRTKRGSEPDQQ